MILNGWLVYGFECRGSGVVMTIGIVYEWLLNRIFNTHDSPIHWKLQYTIPYIKLQIDYLMDCNHEQYWSKYFFIDYQKSLIARFIESVI